MGDITVHLSEVINEDDIRQVKQAMSQVNKDDHLQIFMGATEAHQADAVIALLENNHFDYQPKSSHDGQTYKLIAKKM